MTEKERVTVDLDAQCYYLDDEFWISWDKFGEDMAEAINKLLNEQEERIKQLETELNNYKPIIFKYDGEDFILYSKKGDVE